jgi:hypothetical protein
LPASGKRSGKLTLTSSISVGVGSVEKVDPELIVRAPNHRDGLLVCLFSPPSGGHSPHSESDLAHADFGLGKRPELHVQSLLC